MGTICTVLPVALPPPRRFEFSCSTIAVRCTIASNGLIRRCPPGRETSLETSTKHFFYDLGSKLMRYFCFFFAPQTNRGNVHFNFGANMPFFKVSLERQHGRSLNTPRHVYFQTSLDSTALPLPCRHSLPIFSPITAPAR